MSELVGGVWDPGRARLFESGLQDMTMAAFDDARADRQAQGQGQRVIQTVQPIAQVAMAAAQTCYKLFKREVLARIDLTEDGFGFCPAVTSKVGKLVRQGSVRLVEVPIRYHGRTRADGKKIRLRDGLHALACLWRHRR